MQEFLAPSRSLFYDESWRWIGSREDLSGSIEEVTGIKDEFLRAESRRVPIKERVSVSKKMSWLARRETSRVEDMAYCMLGLFDVNMPLLYGEGEKAFMRLQLGIISKAMMSQGLLGPW